MQLEEQLKTLNPKELLLESLGEVVNTVKEEKEGE
jgi:hypothetical protein